MKTKDEKTYEFVVSRTFADEKSRCESIVKIFAFYGLAADFIDKEFSESCAWLADDDNFAIVYAKRNKNGAILILAHTQTQRYMVNTWEIRKVYVDDLGNYQTVDRREELEAQYKKMLTKGDEHDND